MKISDRIALLKAGYTKDEISELIAADQEKAEEVRPEESPAQADYMDVIRALASEVQGLKNAVQSGNVADAEVKKDPQRTAEDIMKELFAAPPKKER